jgi:serine/threonine protein phosphatase PrpC
LWGEVQDEEIERLLGIDLEPRRSVTRLVRAANDAGGGDNITAIVLDVPWPDAPEVEDRPTPDAAPSPAAEAGSLEDPPTVSSLSEATQPQ